MMNGKIYCVDNQQLTIRSNLLAYAYHLLFKRVWGEAEAEK